MGDDRKKDDQQKIEQSVEARITLPVLPLRDMVVFPHMAAPLFVGREKSVRALEFADGHEGQIMLVAQKEAAENDPQAEDIYHTGVVAQILQVLKLPDGTIKVLVEGKKRARIESSSEKDGMMVADLLVLADLTSDPDKLESLAKSVVQRFSTYAGLKKKLSAEAVVSLNDIEDISQRTDTLAVYVAQSVEERQTILEAPTLYDRLEKIYVMMEKEISTMRLEKKIRGKVKNQMEKTQREYYLNEQLKAIQSELGEGGEGGDFAELAKRIKETKLSKEAREKAEAEFKKLKQMNSMSAESTVVRNYLDWLLSIPWNVKAPLKSDLADSEKKLDEDHYGLEKVKERILEYLAVQKRAGKLRGPILCLVGPPGVGKTSLGKSIARATGRQLTRLPLGGVRDEAEIRGHRRTYIGSQPGRIIQSMKKVKYSNPLFLLDEVDKIGADFRGDPAAALLEVLDPEQNHVFADHYLEVDYDLSDVMFITTANTLDIPPALLDRMEVIRIPGYTEDEKIEIAKRHLIPKAVEAHGLEAEEWQIEDAALVRLIRRYTREAGVRALDRKISTLARKTVKKILTEDKTERVISTADNLTDMLGAPEYMDEEIERENKIGVVTGMAWTQFGGELLTIESVFTPGSGKMRITGNLRDVMKESIAAAQTFVRSHAPEFGVEPSLFERRDIHIHLPEAATPKDGPSAGVALVGAIVSLASNIAARRDVAMTGEITLRGRVLPIGGLKEKMLAAQRAGIKKVLIPKGNVKDLADIPAKIKDAIEIVHVEMIDDIFPHILTRLPEPIDWIEEGIAMAPSARSSEGAASQGGLTAH